MSEAPVTQARLKSIARRCGWAFFAVALIGCVCGWTGILVVAGIVLALEYV